MTCSTPLEIASSAFLSAGPSLPFSDASTPSALPAAFLAFFLSLSAFFAAAFLAFSSLALRASSPPNCSRHSCSFSGLIWENR